MNDFIAWVFFFLAAKTSLVCRVVFPSVMSGWLYRSILVMLKDISLCGRVVGFYC